LGLSQAESEQIPALGLNIDFIKRYLSEHNPYVHKAEEMIKTTPPGRGSRLLTVQESNDLYDYFVKDINGIRLMAVGPFAESDNDLGVNCYHSKTGSVDLLLNHLIDYQNEYVIVDMTAGADSFASGLFTRFDITFLVVEPTIKSVGVYEQYKQYAKDYDVCIRVIGNKVEDESDREFIESYVGQDLRGTFSHSKFVRTMEKGHIPPISDLEPGNQHVLDSMLTEINSQEKDWDTFYKQAIYFHRKNGENWANSIVGFDVSSQIDPDFSLKETVETM